MAQRPDIASLSLSSFPVNRVESLNSSIGLHDFVDAVKQIAFEGFLECVKQGYFVVHNKTSIVSRALLP